MRLGFTVTVAAGLFAVAGCAPSGNSGTGSGGATGAGTGGMTTPGSGGGTSTGSGGSSTTGSGGATATTGGASGTATGGSTSNSGGASASGGQTGSGGRGGAATGTGGGTASGGRGGTTAGTGGAATGTGGGAMGGAGAGDSYVANVSVTVHPQINTVLVVTWMQMTQSTETWLEFSFEAGNVMTSRHQPGATGMHRDVVLGVPGAVNVTLRIMNSQGATTVATKDYTGMTKAVPSGMPVGTVMNYDATLASPDRWLLGAVEDSEGGGDVDYYRATAWLFVMDRKGRVVWYWADPASNATSGFVRQARDGDYIIVDKRSFSGGGSTGVVKMSLDRQYFEQVTVPGLSDCIDTTTDGSLLYDVDGELRERNKAGTVRNIWNCHTVFGAQFNCYTNTVTWNQKEDTVFMSFPEPRMIVEINRATGMLVAQFGAGTGAWTFAPPLTTPPTAWSFGFQHFPNLTAAGTLLVSSHMPGFEATNKPTANQHAFIEFTLDRTAKKLTEKWRYTDGPEWPHAKGMAIRLANGNTLVNYGTGGVIRELTADKKTVFYVKFDTPTGSDFYNKMVGNTFFVNDLYALNGKPK